MVRYSLDGRTGRGAVVGDLVHKLPDGNLDQGPLGRVVGRLGDLALLPPCDPRVIVCAGSNYAGQIAEKGRPWPTQPPLFLKAPNAIVGPEAEILRPAEVLGYTCANDVTAHDWRADGQWTRAKSADTFCPLGPWIETHVPNPSALRIITRLDGQVVQKGSTSEMVFGIGELLAFVTRWITLEPGDVLLTGSPAGVGPMVPGNVVEVEISGIGTLRNTVADRD
jgi:2-keto-4-pentenoate hydratase/2-oxohepta-3-ene-1,7-dioic acid hydratase in catechol pathway